MKAKYLKKFLSVTMAITLACTIVPVHSLAYDDPETTVTQEGEAEKEGVEVTVTQEDETEKEGVEVTLTQEDETEKEGVEVIATQEVGAENEGVEVTSLESRATNIDVSWYNTTDTAFVLSTAEQLKGFAAIVNGEAEGIEKDNFAGKTVTLANNIAVAADGLYTATEGVKYGKGAWAVGATQYVISEEAPIWTPIGKGAATSNTNATKENAFAGIFDGAGYTISGIYTGTKDVALGNTDTVQGLFGVVTGKIQNLTVSGCIAAQGVVGGIVAHLEGGSITNCINNAVVFADGGTTPNGDKEDGKYKLGAVGGIVGNVMGNSAVIECVNNGTIICANTAKGGRTGGIIGLIDGSDEVRIEKNMNAGEVSSYQYAAGIVGLNFSSQAPIDRCYNTGKIVTYNASTGKAGGIVGEGHSNITNCYNTGNVGFASINSGDKASHIGGIVSDLVGAKIINCYNTGELFMDENHTWTSSSGQICGSGYGYDGAWNTVNCYSVLADQEDKIYEEDYTAGAITALDADEMKSAEFVTGLNVEDNAFKVVECASINNGFPVLDWQKSEHTLVKGTCSACGSVLFTLGNVNNDDKVDLKDIILLQQYIVGGYDVTINENAADVSGDGKVDLKDVILIQQYVAKMIEAL